MSDSDFTQSSRRRIMRPTVGLVVTTRALNRREAAARREVLGDDYLG
ncbi:hypothetical protein [Streptomyces olivochromogenes]|nr:hypothetical protein [Streptomyces olivochromogenes]MCF3132764.1 hypothetical protein [Streptomyces olivochromogenes]